jgi:hypothetical protein
MPRLTPEEKLDLLVAAVDGLLNAVHAEGHCGLYAEQILAVMQALHRAGYRRLIDLTERN